MLNPLETDIYKLDRFELKKVDEKRTQMRQENQRASAYAANAERFNFTALFINIRKS